MLQTFSKDSLADYDIYAVVAAYYKADVPAFTWQRGT